MFDGDMTEQHSTDIESLEMAFRNATIALPPEKKTGLAYTLSMWSRPFVMAHRIPVFKRVWLYVALMALYAFAVDCIADRMITTHLFKEFGSVSSIGIILGLLLVFRTNSAYERWWEGRKLWGQLVNDSRNICLKIRALDTIRPSEKVRFGELIISFSYALKHHLRDTVPSRPLPGVGPLSDSEVRNIPLHVAGKIYDVLFQWRRDGHVDSFMSMQLDGHALQLMNIAGSCERIKNSPIAISYRAFMRQGIALNLLAMPWYLSQEFSILWLMPLVMISTYFLIGIELIAEDIEDPFGYDGDDLPLDNICAGIKDTISQILKVRDDRKFTRSMEMPRFDLLKENPLVNPRASGNMKAMDAAKSPEQK
ncbi:MAG: hypothetical protein IT342_09905 [Candidatus Melainabacteria bacterium]|nr:hypothetical protein [Candidatus Melainabacteria bacterium]